MLQAVRSILGKRSVIAKVLQQSGMEAVYIQSAITHAAMLADPSHHGGAQQIISELLQRVEINRDGFRVVLALNVLVPNASEQIISLSQHIPMMMQRRGHEMRIVIAGQSSASEPDPALLTSIARGRQWSHDLITGRFHTMREIAAHYGVSDSYVKKLMPMAFLSPAIVDAMVSGRQPAHLTKQMLIRRIKIPMDWKQQHRAIGLVD